MVDVATSFRPTTPVRIIGGYLASVGFGLASVWISTWAAYAFAGRPTPVEPEVFTLVAAIASIQASLYLLVLSVNSMVGIQRGLAKAPGEVPMWGTLVVFTTAITLLLLTNVRRERTLF